MAMADVFDFKLKNSYEGLQSQYADKMDVPEERRIVSFDGYKQVMDMLFALCARYSTTLMLITHDEKLAKRCERTLHMRDGRVHTSKRARAAAAA